MRKLILVTATGVIAAAGMLTLAGTAAADSNNSVITRATTAYTSPSQNSEAVASLEAGTPVQSLCYTEGQRVDGTSTWFRISTDGDGRPDGFVNRSAIDGAQSALPHC